MRAVEELRREFITLMMIDHFQPMEHEELKKAVKSHVGDYLDEVISQLLGHNVIFVRTSGPVYQYITTKKGHELSQGVTHSAREIRAKKGAKRCGRN